MVKISVIIPTRISTYDRLEKFKNVISLLSSQTINKELYEIILVDDGSDINLKHEIKETIDKNNVRIILLHQKKNGPAAARNLGVKEAKGEILLFLGDDIIAQSNLLEEHLRMHRNYNNCAITNPIMPPVDLNEFTRFITGNCENIEEGVKHEIDSRLGFCTACVSLYKRWLEQEPFDENFKDPALEDTELGIRLHKRGLKIVLTRRTGVCHDHVHDIQSIMKRAKNCGKAAVYLIKKHPVRNVVPTDISGFKYNIRKIIYCILFRFFKKFIACEMPKRYAQVIYTYNEILGIEEGRRLWLEKPKNRRFC